MIDNNTAINILHKINISPGSIFTNPNFPNTILISDIDDNANFNTIAAITECTDRNDPKYSLQIATPNYMTYNDKLGPNDELYIPFNGQLTKEILKAVKDNNDGINETLDPTFYDTSVSHAFTSTNHNNIAIDASLWSSNEKFIIEGFLAYNPSTQEYIAQSLFGPNTASDDDYGYFYDVDGRILNETEYNNYLNNK